MRGCTVLFFLLYGDSSARRPPHAVLDLATVVLPGVSDDAIDGFQHLIETCFHDGLTLLRCASFSSEDRESLPVKEATSFSWLEEKESKGFSKVSGGCY